MTIHTNYSHPSTLNMILFRLYYNFEFEKWRAIRASIGGVLEWVV